MNGGKRRLSGEESVASAQNAPGAGKAGKLAESAGNLASGEALAKRWKSRNWEVAHQFDATSPDRDCSCGMKIDWDLNDYLPAHHEAWRQEHLLVVRALEEATQEAPISLPPVTVEVRNEAATDSALTLNESVQCAARDLPDGFQIHVHVEKGAGWVSLDYPGTQFYYSPDGGGMTLSEQVNECIEKARATRIVLR